MAFDEELDDEPDDDDCSPVGGSADTSSIDVMIMTRPSGLWSYDCMCDPTGTAEQQRERGDCC